MSEVRPERPVYIYLLRDPLKGNAIRYVGQSVDPHHRLISHLCEARSGLRGHRGNWLRKLIAHGVDPVLQVIEEATAQNWEERERYWIALYRGLGHDLINATDGGEGTLGLIPSAETRARMSAARLGKKRPPEMGQKLAAARRGKPRPAEFVEAMCGQFIAIAPDGSEIEITGLFPFNRRHGLYLDGVLYGRAKHSRGWRIRRPDDPPLPALSGLVKGLPYIVTDPSGEHSLVFNVTRFCRERDIERWKLFRSFYRHASYEGWQMVRAVWMEGGWQIPDGWTRFPEFEPNFHCEWKGKQAPVACWQGKLKTYILTDPDGEEITVTHLSRFCSERGLTASALHGVIAGQRAHHKGWKMRRPG